MTPGMSIDEPTSKAGAVSSPPVTPSEDPDLASPVSSHRLTDPYSVSADLTHHATQALTISATAVQEAVRADMESPFQCEIDLFSHDAMEALLNSCTAVNAVRAEVERLATEQAKAECLVAEQAETDRLLAEQVRKNNKRMMIGGPLGPTAVLAHELKRRKTMPRWVQEIAPGNTSLNGYPINQSPLVFDD